jgi:hypothetical protein
MPEEPTTQFDARFTRVEDDLRQLRSDTNVGFTQLNVRLDQLNLRFDQLMWRVIGLFVLTWVTVIGSIWLKA